MHLAQYGCGFMIGGFLSHYNGFAWQFVVRDEAQYTHAVQNLVQAKERNRTCKPGEYDDSARITVLGRQQAVISQYSHRAEEHAPRYFESTVRLVVSAIEV